MTAYYNEIDPFAAQWLRNLISAGHIAPGDVDERSIVDVRADDLKSYTQAHFFAGIGGWSIALRSAGWPDDRPVWTGSCPCQPFSAAGAGKAADDERHLWPAWFPLIAQRQPAIVFGEQVEEAIGWGWLDAVFSDLEGEGYACGTAVLPACCVGAPHNRKRLWFVADADGGDASPEGIQRGGQHGQRAQDGRAGELAYATDQRHERSGSARRRRGGYADGRELGHADEPRLERYRHLGELSISEGRPGAERHDPASCFWGDCEWIACTDGKARPVGPGSFPLGHGIPRRAPKLRAYGNAIVPQVATEFIMAADFAMSSDD